MVFTFMNLVTLVRAVNIGIHETQRNTVAFETKKVMQETSEQYPTKGFASSQIK
jgi:hypothetical protein